MKGEGLCSNTIVKILAAKIFLLFYVLSHSFWAMLLRHSMDIFYFTMGNLAEVGDTLPNIVLLKQQ